MIGCSGKLLGLVALLKQSQIIPEEDNEEAANARSKKAQEES
jgi:SNF2 family DNA or RNA helicase